MAIWGRAASWAKAIFVKICYFEPALRCMHDESIQYEMEDKSIWRQKSGTASNSTCPFGTKKVGGRLLILPNIGSVSNAALCRLVLWSRWKWLKISVSRLIVTYPKYLINSFLSQWSPSKNRDDAWICPLILRTDKTRTNPSLEVAPTTLLLIYSFHLRSAFQPPKWNYFAQFHLKKNTFPSWPWTLTYDPAMRTWPKW